MMSTRRLLCAALLSFAATAGWAQSSTLVMASTTSTEQSGLFGHLLPAFTQATGITVHVVAVGTGQAIDMARRGDADVLFVHDRAAEEKYVAEGYAPRRAMSIAWPVPTATTLTSTPVAFVKAGSRCGNRPDCSVDVVDAIVIVPAQAAVAKAARAMAMPVASVRRFMQVLP